MRIPAVRSKLLIGAIVLPLAMPATAHAQNTVAATSTPGKTAGGAGDTTTGGDILVTATRRAAPLEKIPVAVNVFGPEALRQINAVSVGAVLQTIPGFNFSSENYYRPFATLRGVQGSNEDAAVGMYLDGVYIGQEIGQNIALIDPESVQVLRGPQGALYGKSTLGGAIVITSRKPQDDFHVDGSASYGNFDARDVRGTVTGPLAQGKLDFLLSGYYDANNGTFRNIFLDRDVNAHSDFGFHTALRLIAVDRLTVDLSGDYNNDNRDIGNFKAVFTQIAQPANGLAPGLNNESSSDQLDPTHIINQGVNLTTKYAGDAVTITSISAYRHYSSVHERDADASGADAMIYDNNQSQTQYSEDLTISSSSTHRFNWIAGAEYYRSRMSLLGDFTDLIGNNLFNYPTTDAPVDVDIVVPKYVTSSYALYAQGDFKITPKLTLAAGIRYSHDHRTFLKTETAAIDGGAVQTLDYNYNQAGSWSAPTPEASLSYQVTPSVLTYVKYSRSYRPGGFNVNGVFNLAENAFQEETANAYEAGFKGNFLGGRFTTNLTAYLLDWHDQQVSFNGALGFETANVNSRSRGIELESSVTPIAGLKLDGSIYYDQATFGSAFQNYRDPVTRVNSLIQVDGDPLLYAPKWSWSAAANYKVAVNDRANLLLQASANYRSSIYLIPGRTDLLGPGYTRVNGRAELQFGAYSVAIFARNIFNRFSYFYAQSYSHVDVVGVTEPRTYGVQLSFHY